jgi:hypothetical protein
MRGACKKEAIEAMRVFHSKPPGGYLGGGGLHRLRLALRDSPRPAGNKTRSAVGRLVLCRALVLVLDDAS